MKKLLASIFTNFFWGSTALAAGLPTQAVDTSKVAFPDIGPMITVLVQAAIIIAGLAAFVYLLLGGFQYLTSGGDKVQAQAARDRITYAILGLAIVVAAVAITNILGAVFGVNILGGIKFPGPGTTVGQ